MSTEQIPIHGTTAIGRVAWRGGSSRFVELASQGAHGMCDRTIRFEKSLLACGKQKTLSFLLMACLYGEIGGL